MGGYITRQALFGPTNRFLIAAVTINGASDTTHLPINFPTERCVSSTARIVGWIAQGTCALNTLTTVPTQTVTIERTGLAPGTCITNNTIGPLIGATQIAIGPARNALVDVTERLVRSLAICLITAGHTAVTVDPNGAPGGLWTTALVGVEQANLTGAIDALGSVVGTMRIDGTFDARCSVLREIANALSSVTTSIITRIACFTTARDAKRAIIRTLFITCTRDTGTGISILDAGRLLLWATATCPKGTNGTKTTVTQLIRTRTILIVHTRHTTMNGPCTITATDRCFTPQIVAGIALLALIVDTDRLGCGTIIAVATADTSRLSIAGNTPRLAFAASSMAVYIAVFTLPRDAFPLRMLAIIRPSTLKTRCRSRNI